MAKPAKGQIIPEADWRAIHSPNKRTTICFCFPWKAKNKFIGSFLGESTVRQSAHIFFWLLECDNLVLSGSLEPTMVGFWDLVKVGIAHWSRFKKTGCYWKQQFLNEVVNFNSLCGLHCCWHHNGDQRSQKNLPHSFLGQLVPPSKVQIF